MYDSLITPARIHPWGSEELLEATEQDRARIVQAAPVRRLQQKTQVFPLDVKASVRSRLTHSLEVQETGRQISRRILAALPAGSVCEGAFINLVEMSCLLHDVGNPPFGHFGEQVMSQWLAQALDDLFAAALGQAPSPQWAELRQDLLVFDGNAQSLRLVHSLHELNLTLGQLAALCKYPQQPLHDGQHHGWASKRGIFFSEQPLYRSLSQSLGLAPGCRHPLVYIMEAADDISYCIADLEDAVDRRILTKSELLAALRAADQSDYMGTLLDEALASGRGFFPHFRQQLTRDLVARAEEGAAQVGVQDPAPCVGRNLVQGQGVAQLGAADDAGFFADQVARIGAGPVAVAVLDGGVELVRRRKVVRVLVAHKVQRHLRQRALEVPQARKQPRHPKLGKHEAPNIWTGMKKHRAGV